MIIPMFKCFCSFILGETTYEFVSQACVYRKGSSVSLVFENENQVMHHWESRSNVIMTSDDLL